MPAQNLARIGGFYFKFMAQRRMFSKSITNSSRFLMMPQSAQNLYFHFGMNADDDGFCEHFTVMRMTESKPDDLKVLQAKGFVKIFDEKILIILAWKENNYLRKDRYTPSKYLEEYKEEIRLLVESGQPVVDQRLPQVRLGKDRLVKKREQFSSFKKKLKPYYNGMDMRKSKGKWWAIPKNGGAWLEFVGKEEDIEWK